MPKKRGTRWVATQLLDTAAEDNSLDYFGNFTKRKKLYYASTVQDPTSKAPREQIDERTARLRRRDAAKLSQTRQALAQKAPPRQRIAQLARFDDNEDEVVGQTEEDEAEEEADDSGTDGVNHERITQAMNQARNRATKPTINRIGSLQREDQHQHTEASLGNGEDDQELFLSQSPEGYYAHSPRNTNDRPTSRHGANSKAHQKKKQRSQGYDMITSPLDVDERDSESSIEYNDHAGEDTAFVEAPQQGEKTETVKVVINSMGGIFKTLQHPAWTGSPQWALEFGSEDYDDQETCKTGSGRTLMGELQGLNNILGEATKPLEESGDDHDFTETAIAYLRTESEAIQHHVKCVGAIIDEICRRKLLPTPRAGDPRSKARAVEQRRALLQDLPQRLIPMLLIVVKKACNICLPEDSRSKTTLHVDCFRLQFFLRPLAWANRLHEALERGLRQRTGDEESQTDADGPDEGGSQARHPKKKARAAFGSQLGALYSAFRKAEREIQDKAAEAERQEREEEISRQNREREVERQREIAARNKQKEDEQRRIDERKLQAFIAATHALRSRPDPMKELWDQSQDKLPEHLRATTTVRASQAESLAGHGQSNAEGIRSQGGPSRNGRVEPIYQSDDPFLDNYRPRPEQASNTSNTSRAWSEKEQKSMIRAIRYKGNYDVVCMAQKLRRSEDDVTRMAACLKQAYREAYTKRRVEIPAWAL
jgi:hypothetical protein